MARLKICGLTRAEDLRACVELGVDAVGLNLWPGSRRFIDLADAAELLTSVSERGVVTKVGVFVDAELGQVEQAIARLDLDLIQPHGEADPRPYAELAGRYGIGWIEVVRGTPAISSLVERGQTGWRRAHRPRFVLLDAAVPGFGGAGQQTDWDWAAAAVEALAPAPVWLAGGITPENVAEALVRVRPAGIDVASGAERGGAPGIKDADAIAALVEACGA